MQLSTGGSVHDPLEQRLTVLDAEPDSCSLTCGTTNFGDDVFLNPWGFMVDLYVQAQEREVVPEFELFDLGHVHALRRLLDTHGLPFGGQGARRLRDRGAGRDAGHDRRAAGRRSRCCPAEVTTWSATGIGRGHLPIMAAALSAGGHLRVGMEDNVVFARGPGRAAQRRAGGAGRRAGDGDAAAAAGHRRRPASCSGSRTGARAEPAATGTGPRAATAVRGRRHGIRALVVGVRGADGAGRAGNAAP